MRLLFLVNQLGTGGVQRKAALLAEGLLKRGHEVDVATFFGGVSFAEPILSAGGRVLSVGEGATYGNYGPVARVWNASRRWVNLRRLVREGDYQVVYGIGLTPGVYAALASPLVPARAVMGIELTLSQGRRERMIPSVASRASDLVIAVSQDVAETCLQAGFSTDRLVVIENGVDVDRFRIYACWRRMARSELGIDEEAPLVGTLGRIAPVKNIEGFLRACKSVAARNNRARFIIVGAGEPSYITGLRTLSGSLGIEDKVFWLGARSDLERWYNALDVYVSSSTREGMPLTRIEAMACGTPCVATDVGDARRIVGSNGLVVPVGDADALAAAIEQVLSRPDGWSREAIRSWVVDRFSAEKQISRTEAALRMLLDQG